MIQKFIVHLEYVYVYSKMASYGSFFRQMQTCHLQKLRWPIPAVHNGQMEITMESLDCCNKICTTVGMASISEVICRCTIVRLCTRWIFGAYL
jgi:hypothetical protein